MTPEEAIEDLQYLITEYEAYPPETGVCTTIGTLQYVISALKEIQKYREIGTVEECREAREKQTPNKPKDGLYGHGYFACGSCKNPLDGDESYCPQCGQAIRWEN